MSNKKVNFFSNINLVHFFERSKYKRFNNNKKTIQLDTYLLFFNAVIN